MKTVASKQFIAMFYSIAISQYIMVIDFPVYKQQCKQSNYTFLQVTGYWLRLTQNTNKPLTPSFSFVSRMNCVFHHTTNFYLSFWQVFCLYGSLTYDSWIFFFFNNGVHQSRCVWCSGIAYIVLNWSYKDYMSNKHKALYNISRIVFSCEQWSESWSALMGCTSPMW